MSLGSHCYSEKHPTIQSSYSRNWRTSSGRLSEIAGKKTGGFWGQSACCLNITLHRGELFLVGRIPVLFTTCSSCGDIDFDVLSCSFTVIEPTLSLVPNMEESSSKSLAPYYWLEDFTALERLLSVHTGLCLFLVGWEIQTHPITHTHTALFFCCQRHVTKRLLGQRRKATLLGWLESGRNWSASEPRVAGTDRKSVTPPWNWTATIPPKFDAHLFLTPEITRFFFCQKTHQVDFPSRFVRFSGFCGWFMSSNLFEVLKVIFLQLHDNGIMARVILPIFSWKKKPLAFGVSSFRCVGLTWSGIFWGFFYHLFWKP